jgi:hypothetical protein
MAGVERPWEEEPLETGVVVDDGVDESVVVGVWEAMTLAVTVRTSVDGGRDVMVKVEVTKTVALALRTL